MAGSGSTQLQRVGLHSGSSACDPAADGRARGLGVGSLLRAKAGEGAGRVRAKVVKEQLSRRRDFQLG